VAALSVVVLFSPSDGGVSPFPGSDKVVHLLLFAALAGTSRWRFGDRALSLAALAAYAIGSEVVQGVLMASRSGDPLDVVADLLGVGIGWLVTRRLLA
jgi:hypothetical protein